MDSGWEWQARRDSVKSSAAGGDTLVVNAVHWDNEEWQRYTPESKCFPSGWCTLYSFPEVRGSFTLYSFCVASSSWPNDCTAELPLLVKSSGLDTSTNIAVGFVGGDLTFSPLVNGATEGNCSSNALRYKERRYCSKYTTSNSNTAISLINLDVGWSKKKSKNKK